MSLTLGEWEEHIGPAGWEPLHVERGFGAGQGCVTAMALTGMTLLIDQTSRYRANRRAGWAMSALAVPGQWR